VKSRLSLTRWPRQKRTVPKPKGFKRTSFVPREAYGDRTNGQGARSVVVRPFSRSKNYGSCSITAACKSGDCFQADDNDFVCSKKTKINDNDKLQTDVQTL